MTRLLLISLGLYLTLGLSIFLFQRSFIYPAPNDPGSVPEGFEVVEYATEDGLILRAGYRAAGAGKPTILYFHGNGADWQSSVVATDRLVPAGYGVLAAEYRGYSGNPGSPSEEGLYFDGRAAVSWLSSQGIEAKGLAVIGNSIGSGVAVEIAREIQPGALVLISPFNSLKQVVGEKVWWLPTSILLKDHYRNDIKLPEVQSPILVLHGDSDTVVPVAHGRELAASNPDAKYVSYAGIGHDLAWHDKAELQTLEFLEDVIAR